ncbi:hypothetical protein H1C71_038745, partial [Ictidomys tridecemlineatus]
GRGAEEEGEVVWAARQARVSAGGRGCLAEERPSVQAPLGTRDSRPQPPPPSDLGVHHPAPSRIPESEPLANVSQDPGVHPHLRLLRSDLGVHTVTPTHFGNPSSEPQPLLPRNGPQTLPPLEPRVQIPRI